MIPPTTTAVLVRGPSGRSTLGPSGRSTLGPSGRRTPGPSGCSTDGHFRRFKAYDYSRGAALFVTFGVKGRPKVFGRIAENGQLIHSPAGLAAAETLVRESQRGTGIEVKHSVIMPDHAHLRFYIHPNLDKPLAKLAQFVANFKRWSKYRCQQLGIEIEWEDGYHDRLCLSREIIDLADKYIANNPLKWSLMHGNPPPLKVAEPIDSPRFPMDEWWSGVGSLELMADNRKICAVQLSRKILANQHAAVVDRLMSAVDKGFVLAGTFISPCERQVARALLDCGAPMIRAVPDALAMVYRPKQDEPQQFAQGRLLLLSRVAAGGVSRYEAWHGINAALGDAAQASGGGTSVYVHPDSTGKLAWDFRSASA